jgi:DNA repair photolyase
MWSTRIRDVALAASIVSRAAVAAQWVNLVASGGAKCEATYRLTQGILQVICKNSHPFPVNILTKFPLVLRAPPILKELLSVEVGMSIATVDERLAGVIEPKAPKVTRRLRVLERLSAAGI